MFSQSPSTLYICSANVGRSQMAEGIHNQRFSQLGGAISLAGAEARKKKYNGRPSELITDFMLKEHEIAINRQAISYIGDFSQAVIEGVERIIFLYNPLEEIACDDECKIDTLRPYDYLLSRWPRKIRISPVTDPALEAVEKYEKIYQDILLVIKGL